MRRAFPALKGAPYLIAFAGAGKGRHDKLKTHAERHRVVE